MRHLILYSTLAVCTVESFLSRETLFPARKTQSLSSAFVVGHNNNNNNNHARGVGFQQRRHRSRASIHTPQQPLGGRLYMALTPIGPFCPFRSSAAVDMEPRMESMTSGQPNFATDLNRLQLEMQLNPNAPPDPDRLTAMADAMDRAVAEWQSLLTRLTLSEDFQTREYGALVQCHLQRHNTTVEATADAMTWQAECMRCMAQGSMPPMPPASVDLEALMTQQQQQQGNGKDGSSGGGGPPSAAAMSSVQAMTATPFSEQDDVFESDTVRAEYEQLCRDHMGLIEFGEKYDGFDGVGKLYFLDEIDKIEERWDVFYARFRLLGALNPEYVTQCNEFLSSMGLTEEDYRALVKQCHLKMRESAEQERNRY